MAKKSSKRTRISKKTLKAKAPLKKNDFKSGLLEVDNQEDRYDKLFEQKLSQQYQDFRKIKDTTMQSKKFIRLLFVLLTIILLALLILTYG